MQTFYAVISHMDRQIGRFLERLDQAGLRDNTLVIFTSDNGAPSRQSSADSGRRVDMALDSAGSNGALRGWKWHLREGGIRVPFIARWPGRIPARRIDPTSVLNICDLTPTLIRLAGGDANASSSDARLTRRNLQTGGLETLGLRPLAIANACGIVAGDRFS